MELNMKRILRRCPLAVICVISIAVMSVALSSCGGEPGRGESPHAQENDAITLATVPPGTESILDRVVHIEPELITEIPDTPRWCERLGLESRRINVGGAELFVEEEGEGMPLVLVNGGPGGTHHYFHPWFARAGGFARVIYYDQRGCGLSDFEPGEDGYSVEQAAGDLEALRQALGIDEWVVLGYSYGGFLAQLYTTKYPRSVAGLVLLGASPGVSKEIGPSRQREFMSEEELARRDEIREQLQAYAAQVELPQREYVQLSVYNNFLNGDWKRQGFYKPTAERMAQIALYEWDHDGDFNSVVGQSQSGIDFTGIFDDNPIPTLILEGEYDLTWNETKAGILAGNHPNGRLVVFENAVHSIYDEAPDRFFEVLEEFVTTLPEVDPVALDIYAGSAAAWWADIEASREASPAYALESTGWGWNSSRDLAARYNRAWLDQFEEPRSFMRMGFALYDVEDYEEGLYVFERMLELAMTLNERQEAEPNPEDADDLAPESQREHEAAHSPYEAFALIWQGHMLDLLGRREEAIGRYRRAAAMNLDDTWQHGQYGLRYALSPYAAERIDTPFERVDNSDPS
jgi:proline iminopeptidase